MTLLNSVARIPPSAPPSGACTALSRWLLLLLLPAVALAQSSGGNYTLRKQLIASGVVSTGGSYRMTGSVGQAFAAVQTAGSYRLTGGFHGPLALSTGALFCNGFENTPCP